MEPSVNEATWTAFPLLLSSLSETQQAKLEDAACAGTCGRLVDAERIFTDELADCLFTPAFVLSRADMLSSSSRELERHDLLNALANREQIMDQTESLRPLVRLMIADSNFWLHGLVQPLLKALSAAKQYLACKELSELSDVEFRIVTQYYESSANLSRLSRFITEGNLMVFERFGGNRYIEARELRLALQAQARLRFLATAMQLELQACSTLAEMSASADAAIAMAEDLLQQPLRALKYRGIVLARFSRPILTALNRQAALTSLQRMTTMALESMTSPEYPYWAQFCPNIEGVETEEAILASETPLYSKYQQLRVLAGSFTEAKNYTRANQIYIKIRDLFDAALAAGTGLSQDADYTRLIQANGLEFVEFHQWTTRMAFWEGSALSDYVSRAGGSSSYREILELIQAFESRYPGFAVSNILERLYDQGRKSASALADSAAERYYSARHREVINECSYMTEGGDVTDKAITDPDYALVIIFANGTDSLSCGVGALHLMLHWAAFEIRRGQLSVAEAAQIFATTSLDFETASRDDLEETAQEMFKSICGTEEALTSSSDFLRAYNLLLHWIGTEDRKPSREARLTALRYLLQARIFLHGKQLLETRKQFTARQTAFVEANAAMSSEEVLLDDLSTSQRDQTLALERSVQRVLRHCYCFPPDSATLLVEIDEANATCRRLIAIHEAKSALLHWYHALLQLIRLKWQRMIHVRTFSVAEVDALIAAVKEADAVFGKIRSILSSPDASAHLIALVKGANDFLQSEHYRYAFAALFTRYKTLEGAGRAASSEAQTVLDQLADWSLLAKGKGLMGVLQTAVLAREYQPSGDQLHDSLSKLCIGSDLYVASGAPGAPQPSPSRITEMLMEDVVLIDLVDPSYSNLCRGLIALVYRKARPIQLVQTNITGHRIEEWVKTNLHGKHTDKPLSSSDSQARMDELKPLIAPFLDPEIAGYVSEDTTIVWCSTGSLSRVPVHAIPTGHGQAVFIERNPLVYTQSLGLLHHLWQQMAARQSSGPMSRAIINPLPADWESSRSARAIAKALQPVDALHGEEITLEQTLETLKDRRIFSFQGHAAFDPHNLLASALELGASQKMTVQDIMRSVRLAFPALCTLSACASGVSTVTSTSTDDVVSLPTALHFAGASSVVSTLWPVYDSDGAAFADRFYNELIAASARVSNSRGTVDLAKVMQTTVVGLLYDDGGATLQRERRRRPAYHWAAFFLQGFWTFEKIV